jgi:hypothetical protein
MAVVFKVKFRGNYGWRAETACTTFQTPNPFSSTPIMDIEKEGEAHYVTMIVDMER